MRGQKGQATIEYILLLVVVIAIILGVIYQFDSAFQNFAQGYFGQYLACLIETGELPSLDAQQNYDPGSCNSQFQSFSLANGRPPVAGNATGPNTGPAAASSTSQSNAAPVGPPNGNGNLTMLPANGTSITFGQSPSLVPATPPNNQNGKGSSSQDQLGGDALTDLEGGDNGRVIRIPLAESEGIYDDGGLTDRPKKTKIPIAHSALSKAKNKSGAPPLIKATRTIASVQKSTNTGGLSFTKFIRYIIIAVMLIAIVIFIGGQILQVTKSLE